MANTTTLDALKNAMFALMNETTNNNTYTANGRDIEKINDIVRAVSSGFVVSKLNADIFYKCKDIPYLRKRQQFQYFDPMACTADISIGATEIFLDTTNLDNVGAVYAQDVIISYTGKTANSITGCTGVISSFTAGTYFQKCFPLNTDFDKSYRLFHQYNNVQREVFEIQREDERFQRAKYRSFVIILDENTDTKFIVVRGFSNKDRFILKYYAKVVDMVSPTDICIIPDEYCLKIVPKIAAGELLMESQTEDTEYMNKLAAGYDNLQEMYFKYTQQEVDLEKMARMKPYNYSSINSFGMANTRYTRSGFTVF